MNYNPAHNPEYVNECILEYIDNVMHVECQTQKDVWNLSNIFSWQRYGSTICNKCHDNKDKLYLKIHKFQEDYDNLMVLEDYEGEHRVFMPKLNRKTTPYKDVYYKIRGQIEQIGMYELYPKCCNAKNCTSTNRADNSWNFDNMFKLGELLFTGSFEPKCITCKHTWELVTLKIDIMVLESNMELLQLQMEHKLKYSK
jgi:hypothetical protein